ncbi:MAG: NADPH:quinone reductase [Ferrovibrio sp.]|uniref:NADPH:quinone reductase n=1 Tax=Ferrovibrio sp. TaxID=1917215 RepID=UPI00391C3CC5
MQAAWYGRNGAAREVLEVGELPTPQPGLGEVRVRLHASGVNPSDVKSRRGRPLIAEKIVPHSDGAGMIDAVGPDVAASRMNERVWTWNGQWQRPLGTAAEHIVLPARQAVALPDDVDFAAGACFGIPALTAIHAVNLLGDVKGRNVVVIGAATSVGHYVAQVAARRGARVIGTVGSAEKAAHAKTAGVAEVIDYKHEDVAQRVKDLTDGVGADAVVDMDFSTTAAMLAQGILRPHGELVSYGSNSMDAVPVPFRDLLFRSITLRFFVVYELTAAERERAIADLNRLLAEKALRHTIAAHYPLHDIAAAHEAVEQGRFMGNVVLDIA